MMASAATSTAALLLLLFFSSFSFSFSMHFLEEKQTYIVYMAKSRMPATFAEHGHWYDASLRSVSDSAEILYSYDTVAHGFSTRLTRAEAQALESIDGVLYVLPEVRYELHTTRTPEFLGLDKSDGLVPQATPASDVVVGVLDPGVWPERKSFDDMGFGPVPAGWKGVCEEGKDFKATSCNRKLIGARFFSKGYEASMGPIDETKESQSPRDNDGHGTHTSTTAAGSAVTDASLLGFAAGTARGMATRVRLMVYEACWADGCFSFNILAIMEKGVDVECHVLSLFLDGSMSDYYCDSVLIGAFNIMEQ